MDIKYLKEFDKEFKNLSKKFGSLDEDFEVFLKALMVNPRWHIRISWLWNNIKWEFYKVKKFYCTSMQKVNSWFRIIYWYLEEKNRIEFKKIEFIEIYHKNKKSNHDEKRIKKYYKK